MPILLQFCMVRNLLLTFHFWQCLGLVYTCLVLSWRSLRAKIALLCFQILTGKTHSPHPASLFVKLNLGNSRHTPLRWFCVHFVSLVALPCTVLTASPVFRRWELYTGFSLKSLFTSFSMEMTFLKYSEAASPFFMANHTSVCQVIDWCLHVHLSFYHFQLMSSYLIAENLF